MGLALKCEAGRVPHFRHMWPVSLGRAGPCFRLDLQYYTHEIDVGLNVNVLRSLMQACIKWRLQRRSRWWWPDENGYRQYASNTAGSFGARGSTNSPIVTSIIHVLQWLLIRRWVIFEAVVLLWRWFGMCFFQSSAFHSRSVPKRPQLRSASTVFFASACRR